MQKVRAVESLFRILDKDIQKFRNQTGISCIEGCIQCCTSSRIEATSLEFYPLAHYLYITGQAEEIVSKIDQTNNAKLCPLLNHLNIDGNKPNCNNYNYRGLVCRLFAYNYDMDKYGNRRLNVCKIIKAEQKEEVEKARKLLQTRVLGPKATAYYSRLQFIDFNETQKLYPIGTAIKIAIETIIMHFHYNGKKAM